jgi:hypothetical protein
MLDTVLYNRRCERRFRRSQTASPDIAFTDLQILTVSKVIQKSISITLKHEVGGACGTHGRGKKGALGFGGKARRKATAWKPMRRCEYGIRMDLREICWGVWSGFTLLRTETGGGLL